MLNQPNRLGNEVMISFARRDIVSQLSVSKGGLNQHVRRKGRLPLHLCLAPKAQRSAWAWGSAPGFVLPRSVSA